MTPRCPHREVKTVPPNGYMLVPSSWRTTVVVWDPTDPDTIQATYTGHTN